MQEEKTSPMNFLIFYAIKEYEDNSHVDILHNKMMFGEHSKGFDDRELW